MGVNDDLVAPLQSESFRSNAAYGTAELSDGGIVLAHAAGPLSLDFWYDAETGTYWLSDGTLVQSFANAQIDPLQSDASQTTYVRSRGRTTDTLTLTTNGTGPGQTRYVGAGFFQREVEGGRSTLGRFDAFTYGVQTADASMPMTGSASFDVNLIGARVTNWVEGVGGYGTFNLDFSNGAMAGEGWYHLVNLETGARSSEVMWDAYGMVTAGTSDFAGFLRFNQSLSTTLAGSFYGPAADEIGAVWYLSNDDITTVGAIYGARNDYPVNEGTSLAFPEHAMFFTPIANSIRADRDESGVLSNPATHDPVKAIYLDEGNSRPVFYRSADDIVQSIGTGFPQLSYEYFPDNLTYVRIGQQLDRRGPGAIVDSTVYGFNTLPESVPTTGAAHYGLTLRAGLLAPGEELQAIAGYGEMLVEFATGKILVDGNYAVYASAPASGAGYGTPSGQRTDTGEWSGLADIASNGFTGTLLLDGQTDYSGDLDGGFFGPDADEVGAVFHLTGAGAQVGGTFGGALDATPYYGDRTLTELTGPATLPGRAVGTYISNYGGRLSLATGDAEITYDREAQTYSFQTDYYAFDGEFTETLGPDDITDQVDPGFTHYSKGDVSGRILNPGPGNPVINLSYTSFAQFTAPGVEYEQPVEVEHFMHYGLATSDSRMPIGSASYAGVVFGRGANPAKDPTVDIGGTSSLTYDFATSGFTATLNLHIEGGSAGDTALGSYTFGDDGQQFGNVIAGSNADDSFDGHIWGRFYGPRAEEFGAQWQVLLPNDTGYIGNSSYFYGVTVGAQVPPAP